MSSKSKEIYLYHYTTAEGLIGIIKQQNIRATNIFYLNDWEEYVTGIKLAQNYLEQLRDETSTEIDIQRFNWLIKEIKDTGPLRSLEVYISSFSKNGDELSQWRAYCPKGGYAIGFPISRLRALAKKQEFVLKKCVYAKKHQAKIIREAVKEAMQQGPNQNQILQAGPDAESLIRCTLSSKLIWKLSQVCPILKNSAFKSEEEYRLISKPRAGNCFNQTQFKAKNGMIVPYNEFDIQEEILLRKIVVTVGPTPHPAESRASVKSFLRWQTGYAHAVRNTRAPYRSW